MSRIEIKNVEHGNFVLLSELKNKCGQDLVVVRDCGSLHADSKDKIAREVERTLLLDRSDVIKEAILTHPHLDHYYGFKVLHEKGYRHCFDKAYIPWLDFSSPQSLHSKILKVGLYCIHYCDKKAISSTAKEWIKMAPIMYDLSSQLIGVASGYQFEWSQPATVLWPPTPRYYGRSKISRYYTGEQILDLMLAEFDQIDESSRLKVERCFGELYPLYHLLSQENNEGDILRGEGLLSKVEQELDKLPVYEDKVELPVSVKNNKKHYTNIIDDHSIVFRLKPSVPNEPRNGALFLSDLNEKPLRILCEYEFADTHPRFDLLLSSHHGTRMDKVFANNVSADSVVHSCGLGNKRSSCLNDLYSQISTQDTIDCTSWNGEAYKWPDNPTPPYCVKGDMLMNI